MPFAYRILPVRVGTAPLETCSAIGEDVSYGAVRIPMNGIAEELGRSLSEAETRETCKWSERAPGGGARGLGRSASRRRRSGQ